MDSGETQGSCASCVARRAGRWAIERRETLAIAEALSRRGACVQHSVYAYRYRGIEPISARKRDGDGMTIKSVRAERLKSRLEVDSTPANKVCVLQGKDLQRIAKEALGADVSLTTVYCRLHPAPSSLESPRTIQAGGPR